MREWPCDDPECPGEYFQKGHTQPNRSVTYKCSECGDHQIFP